MAVQTQRASPCSSQPVRRKRHRLDSVLKARSASTMAAGGKTITPSEFWNVNLHTSLLSHPCFLWLSYTTAQMESSVGCSSMVYEGSSLGESRRLSLHFLSKATYHTPPLLHSGCQVTIRLLVLRDSHCLRHCREVTRDKFCPTEAPADPKRCYQF